MDGSPWIITDEHHLSISPPAAHIIKLAAMGFNMWCILASFILASAGANRFDRGPQKFYDVSFDTATSEQNENKEVILFLTPDQVRALEAEGALVRSSENTENDVSESVEPQVNEDQSEETDQLENDKNEQENSEDIQNEDFDFEQILRLLNDDQVEEEETEEAAIEQANNEPQVEEENTEKPRNFSPRFSLRQQQQQEQKYLAPAAAKREEILKSYSLIRYQQNEQPQGINVQLQQATADESSEVPQNETPTQERKKYKLVPYEVDEAVEETSQEENAETPQNSEEEGDTQSISDLNTDQLAEALGQRKIRLQQNELQLQSILRELKASPKRNDQKYAIEIQRLKANLDQQNALSKAEAIVKIAPSLLKQQFSKKRLFNKSTKQEKTSVSNNQQQKKINVAPTTARPIPIPVLRTARIEASRPIGVPVEIGTRPNVKSIYSKGRAEKLYTVSRKTPENQKQTLTEVPKSRPERITIVRHIWEN